MHHLVCRPSYHAMQVAQGREVNLVEHVLEIHCTLHVSAARFLSCDEKCAFQLGRGMLYLLALPPKSQSVCDHAAHIPQCGHVH